LLAHGSDDQRLRYLPAILSAEEIWCQLFSEPDAGSDLASLSTQAVPVEGGYLVTGRKVWTSYAQFATWGLCLARTDPDAPRPQQGITALIVEMASPGVEIRPLVQMTGDAEFNEVFLSDVFVPSEQLVGIEGQGWTVAGSTLAHERGTNFPFKEQVVHETYLARLYQEARANGALEDPVVADALAQSYIDLGVLRLHNLRTLTRLGRGEEPGPESSWVKLMWTTMTQHLSETGMAVTGRDPVSSQAGPWARQWLWSQAAGIAGGTSEVQRDIIAGRILGLPR
jgi:alkylation response protein AidB-like acyl-CoA dehydrogenase